MQDGHASFFNIHRQFLGPDHMAREAAEAVRKLQNYHYDGEKKDGIGKRMLHSTRNSTQ